jgi:hypothetical protein
MSHALGLSPLSGIALSLAALCGTTAPSLAQDSGFNLAMHANSQTTAKDLGLPAYPGAHLDKRSNDDGAFDFGFTFGNTTFRVMGASYTSTDPTPEVLAFYRKALTRYGDVLECIDHNPVGAVTTTQSGLTCAKAADGHFHIDSHPDFSGDHELRAGTPHQFRIVAFDDAKSGPTRFVLFYAEVPKHTGSDGRSE